MRSSIMIHTLNLICKQFNFIIDGLESRIAVNKTCDLYSSAHMCLSEKKFSLFSFKSILTEGHSLN